ncbi:MAG: hypothetical protein PHI29_04670 [Gallionella sp.]|nr:hypothetical protein [Gallionella sp.]
MKCITETECSEWLLQHGVDETPYGHGLSRGVHYIQFAPPTSNEDISHFVQALVKSLGNFQGCLLQIHDWMYDSEYEEDPTSSIRLRCGEGRSIKEAPGFVFEPSELSDAIELCALILERDWTAYLYLTSKAATLLLWEGALVDFWSNDAKVEKHVHAELCRSNLRITHRYKG